MLPDLPIGQHLVVVTAIDDDNEQRRVEIPITVSATLPPSVAITAPSTAERIWAGQAVTLRGRAVDPENRLSVVEIWELRHVDMHAGQHPPVWMRLGNATVQSNGTWSYAIGSLPSGRFDYRAIAIDQDGDRSESEVLHLLSSFLIGTDPVYGDAGNFNKNMTFGGAGTWSIQQVDGRLALRAVNGDHRVKTAFMYGTGASDSFRLSFSAKALEQPNVAERYEVAFGNGLLLDMTGTNSIQSSASWVADPGSGTRVYDGFSHHFSGILETFGKHLRTESG